MKIIFEWDARKARINLEKHRVSFDEACTIFHDPLLVTFSDEFHSETDDRFISIGMSERERILLVVHTELDERDDQIIIRIISSRKATLSERKIYEEYQ
jgi:uncharacterized DUF497 family protein